MNFATTYLQESYFSIHSFIFLSLEIKIFDVHNSFPFIKYHLQIKFRDTSTSLKSINITKDIVMKEIPKKEYVDLGRIYAHLKNLRRIQTKVRGLMNGLSRTLKEKIFNFKLNYFKVVRNFNLIKLK